MALNHKNLGWSEPALCTIVAILESVHSKKTADTREKKVGSITRLPKLLSNYNKKKKNILT